MNADLIQRYRSGVPDSVIVYNTPQRSRQQLNADLGVYVQDSWTLKRLTLNPGVRFEYFNVSINAMEVEPGRFVGFRSYPEQNESAELAQRGAAARRGLRPDGRREDRDPLRLEQVPTRAMG